LFFNRQFIWRFLSPVFRFGPFPRPTFAVDVIVSFSAFSCFLSLSPVLEYSECPRHSLRN
jgi:hypothetical protein